MNIATISSLVKFKNMYKHLNRIILKRNKIYCDIKNESQDIMTYHTDTQKANRIIINKHNNTFYN